MTQPRPPASEPHDPHPSTEEVDRPESPETGRARKRKELAEDRRVNDYSHGDGSPRRERDAR